MDQTAFPDRCLCLWLSVNLRCLLLSADNLQFPLSLHQLSNVETVRRWDIGLRSAGLNTVTAVGHGLTTIHFTARLQMVLGAFLDLLLHKMDQEIPMLQETFGHTAISADKTVTIPQTTGVRGVKILEATGRATVLSNFFIFFCVNTKTIQKQFKTMSFLNIILYFSII